MFLTSDFSKRYEKLPVKIFSEQSEAAKVIVRDVAVQLKKKTSEGKKLVLALAASSACLPVYEEFIAAVKQKKLSFKKDDVVVLTVSGRGDKDVETYLKNKAMAKEFGEF